jgi:2-keto-4-pentenoate hydratase/2-oxohepta-3-ene-1,7-dioic acid hydratase in catechol pathway
MRLANLAGRASVVFDRIAFDVERASAGRFSSDPQRAFDHWDELREWGSAIDWAGDAPVKSIAVQDSALQPPAPQPRQVFGVGLNYRSHAAEANLELPSVPVIFTKFPSCLAGPFGDVPLPSDNVDWEVELVVIIGRLSRHVAEGNAWDHIAGVCVGQDISERVVQGRPPVPQFSMGKSFPSFGPFGPAIVTIDELDDPDDLDLSCSINGTQVQHARTSDLIFNVPELIAYLSSIVTLYPGDVIFTGTPSGVGGGRTPKWFLRPGDVIDSALAGVGHMKHICIAGAEYEDAIALTASAS